jgi:hypothetical protein
MRPPSDEIVSALRALNIGGAGNELSIPTVPLSVDGGYGAVRLAKGPEGELRLLVPTILGRKAPDRFASEGVSVHLLQYEVGPHLKPFVEVRCNEAALNGVFLWVVAAILEQLTKGASPEAAVGQTLEEFRELLRRAREFPEERLVGLAGELLVLNRLLMRDARAARVWTGPLKQRFDFSSSRICIEVKASMNRQRNLARIHGLDQLDPPADGRSLTLVHLVLEQSGTGGFSIGELIRETRKAAENSDDIDSRLDALGLSHWESIPAFSERRFSLLRDRAFAVGPSFPRLTLSSFAPCYPIDGVTDIHYTVDLDRATHCSVDLEGQLLMLVEDET